MGRPPFVGLEVYKLSGRLADAVWKIVRAWDAFARDTVGKQLVRRRTESAQTSPRVLEEAHFKTTVGS